MLARRTNINAVCEGVDITKDIQKDLLSFSYTDNASENADDISISLKDEKAKWLKEWMPEKGDNIIATINTINWRHDGDSQILPCGTFVIDEPDYSGRPRILNLKAIATPSNTNFTNTKKSKAWENITLSAIANDIARNAGLSLFFDSSVNPLYDRKDQSEAADMSFLSELCKNEGLAFKVTDKKIIIFNESDYEGKDSIITLTEDSSSVLNYSLKSTLSNTSYAGCNVKYYDTNLQQNIEYLFTTKEIDEKADKIYEINARVSTGEEARRLAQSNLRKLNKKEYTVTMTIVGNILMLGGICVDLKGFGNFDGKYYIDKATHNVGSGYTTDLEMHRVLEGY